MFKSADDSIVFHIDVVDEPFRAAFDFTRPWIFETDDNQTSFATEDEACAAQRDYRATNGFDPVTGMVEG